MTLAPARGLGYAQRMRYRTFTDHDYDALQALDLDVQRALAPTFDTLAERERAGRLHTSLPALKFYERSEHSFVAEDGGVLHGFVFAQSVWQGDRPIVLVRTLSVHPDAPAGTAEGLLHATVKSAYDTAVYEIHYPVAPTLRAAATAEGAVLTGAYAVTHLGTRAQTAPGERLDGQPADDERRTPPAQGA
ncbi:GNAT family acetyltransferase [Deinococcus arenae]|uniref:GNAT family acetyltransferase n=2 Tax=Deinococcus arenae TaxID=1452751 RepID=A0A8H9GHM9_9DEIO|nr:GNAT family acetyltransferase [Deinococcus arenae]